MNRLLIVAVAAAAALAAPSAALAKHCGGGPSAVNVYSECLPGSGGGKSTSGGGSATGGQSSGSQGSGLLPVSKRTARALAHAGKDRRALSNIVRNPGLGVTHNLRTSKLASAPSPTAVGSAFDLGSGPTALLVALAGAAFLLLAGSGLRVWRNRHRP
jgi:hypothetical protein